MPGALRTGTAVRTFALAERKKRQSKQIRNSILDLICSCAGGLEPVPRGPPAIDLLSPGIPPVGTRKPNGNLNTQSTQTDIGNIYSMLSILCSQAFIIEAPQKQHSGRKQIPRYWSEAGLPLSALAFEDMGGYGFESSAYFDLLYNCAGQDVPCMFLYCFCDCLGL